MTISSSNRKAGPFTGNGVTTAFPFNFKVFTTADLYVVLANSTTGVETVQTLTTNYTVSLNADQVTAPGGTVNMLVPPPAGTTLTCTSQVAQTQTVDLQNAGGFYPAVVNLALDKLTVLIQQVQTYLNGALKLPLSAGSSVSATLPSPVANQLLGWNSAGTAIQNYAGVASAAVSSFMASVVAAVDAAAARLALGAAGSGANTDITSIAATTTVDGFRVGFRDIPQLYQAPSTAIDISNAGKQFYWDGAAGTWTIPARSSVNFPVGTTLTFINMTGSNCQIAIGGADSLWLAGSGSISSSNKTLAHTGLATAIKVQGTAWMVSGSGLS